MGRFLAVWKMRIGRRWDIYFRGSSKGRSSNWEMFREEKLTHIDGFAMRRCLLRLFLFLFISRILSQLTLLTERTLAGWEITIKTGGYSL